MEKVRPGSIKVVIFSWQKQAVKIHPYNRAHFGDLFCRSVSLGRLLLWVDPLRIFLILWEYSTLLSPEPSGQRRQVFRTGELVRCSIATSI